jgi:hypothetical protein
VQLAQVCYVASVAEPKDQRIPIMMSRSEVEAIDQWRREQSDLPARAEAIRRLVNHSLTKPAKRKSAG